MKDGIGEGSTREDHAEVANQVYDAYSRAQEVRALAGIVGKAGLTEIDLKYMDVGDVLLKKNSSHKQLMRIELLTKHLLSYGRLYQNYQRMKLLKSKTST